MSDCTEARTRKPDGGSAFPRLKFANGHPDHMTQGITVRDYFAAQMAVALLNSGRTINPNNVAAAAYRYADAMLKERLEMDPAQPAFTPPADAGPS